MGIVTGKVNIFFASDFHTFRVGIIGEQISGFNPFTLTPFGDEDEEDEEPGDEEGEEEIAHENGNGESNDKQR